MKLDNTREFIDEVIMPVFLITLIVFILVAIALFALSVYDAAYYGEWFLTDQEKTLKFMQDCLASEQFTRIECHIMSRN